MESVGLKELQAYFQLLAATMAARREELIALDSVMGDADLGLTMVAAFAAADREAAACAEADLGKLCIKAGMAMAKAAPSTMGTLMATGFMRGGATAKGRAELELGGIADFWTAFVGGIMERGKSGPGEKTVVDALFPAAEAFRASQAQGLALAEAASLAAAAAAAGLEATRSMLAQHGRAAYYQEKSRDKLDPGATVGAILIKGFAELVT